MDRQQHDDVRAIQQMTRWTLAMLQKAEQGLLPPKVLHRIVDPQVVKSMGSFQPHQPGNPTPAPRVGRLRVQLVHDALAHVACVAPRPDGTPAAYVLEFRKPPGKDGWRITELTRAEERRLVRSEERAQQRSGAIEQTRRLTERLDGRIAATRQARADATASLERARATLRQLPDPLPGMKTNTVAQRMKRDPFAQQRAQARRDVSRWQQAIAATADELKELQEMREARELRQRALQGDPFMRVHQWDHLDCLLGPVPKDLDQRARWRHAASTIETYRDRWHITDPNHALGALPADAPPEQRTHHQAASEIAKAHNAGRDQTPARVQELPENLELSL